MIKYKIIKEINRGKSKDKKYIVKIDKNNDLYLLRISKYSINKIKYYKKIKKIYKNINCAKLYKYYVINEIIYAFFTYIPGFSLKDLNKKLNELEKYKYGIQAGKILKKLHIDYSLKISKEISNEYVIENIMENYKNFTQKNIIIDNLYTILLKNQKHLNLNNYVFLNADFHWENMIINNNILYLIDLEKYEIGNKARDFTFIYTCNENKSFANGLLHGYFNNKKISSCFWIDFKYFSILYIIQYYMWCLNKYNNRKDSIIIAKDFLNDYKSNDKIPKWYY